MSTAVAIHNQGILCSKRTPWANKSKCFLKSSFQFPTSARPSHLSHCYRTDLECVKCQERNSGKKNALGRKLNELLYDRQRHGIATPRPTKANTPLRYYPCTRVPVLPLYPCHCPLVSLPLALVTCVTRVTRVIVPWCHCPLPLPLSCATSPVSSSSTAFLVSRLRRRMGMTPIP